MTELETMGGMSALAWLWAVSVFAVVVLALGVAGPRWPVRHLTRRAGSLTGAGAAKAELELRFADGARTARDDWRRRVDLGAERA